MTGGWPQLLWLMFLLIAGAWLVSALAMAPMMGGWIHRVREPAVRSRRILLTAAFPWLVPITVGAAAATTAGSKALGWIADHCPHHGLGHPHLCFSHLPAIDLNVVHGAVASFVAALFLASAARLVRSACRANRQFGLLKALASSRGRVRIVPSHEPFALAGGVLEPAVLLSRGLLDHLSFRQRRIVTAHEAAHLRHGDAWRSVLFELLLLIHVPWVCRRLKEQWLRTLEERADDAAAQRFGAAGVAEALVHVARLRLPRPAPGFSVTGAGLAGRVRRLLEERGGPDGGLPGFEIAYAVVLATSFTATVLGHHALETLLGLIAGH